MAKDVKKVTEKVEEAAEKVGVNLDIPDQINVKVPDQIEIKVPKKIGLKSVLIFLSAAATCVLALASYAYVNIPKASAGIGNTLGTVTGMAVGSLQAAQDAPQAIGEGQEEGRSAEDTKAMVDGFLQNCGQLQVMRSQVKFVNLNNNADNYVSLNKKIGNAIFTVNLLEASYDKDSKILTVPDIEVRLDLKDSTEKLAEYTSSGLFSGNAMDGVIGTINSEVKTTEEAIRSIKDDTGLMTQVRERSIKQLETVLFALTGQNVTVKGSW